MYFSNTNGTKIGIAAAIILIGPAIFRIPTGDQQMRALMRVVAETSLCLCLAGFVAYRVNGWVGAFVALVALSWLYTTIRIPHPTSQRVAYLGRDAIMFGAGALLLFRYTELKWIKAAFIAIGLANLVFIFMQEIGLDPYCIFTFGLMKSTLTHSPGLMANKNETAILFVMAYFASVEKHRSISWLMLAGLCLASSTGGFLALFFGLIVYLRPKFKTIALLFVLAVLAVLAFDFNGPGITERLRIWGLGKQLLADNAIFGVGIGLWPLATNQLHAHNDFLQAFFELGIFAPIITVGYAISVYSRYRVEAKAVTAGVVALAVNALVSFPVHIPVLALMGLALVGQMEAQIGHP